LLVALLLLCWSAAGQPVESSLGLRPGHKTVTVKAVPQQLHFHTHSEHLLGGEQHSSSGSGSHQITSST
jgi:hypothetical protein